MRLYTTSIRSSRHSVVAAAIASLALVASLLLLAGPAAAQPDDYTSYPSYSSYESGPTNSNGGGNGGTVSPPPAPAPVVTQQRTPLSADPPATLPFTGGNADIMTLIAAGLIAVGALAIAGQRRARQVALAPTHLP